VPRVSLVIVPLNFILLGLFFLPHSWLNHAYSMMDGLVGLLVGYLHLLQNWGLQAIQLPVVSGWKILLIVLCLLMVVLPRGMIRMRGWWILLPALIIWPSGKHARPPLTVTVLDVGTGNAIVIETQYHSLIYDFGPGNRWGYSTGDWVVMPFLREEGIQTLDSIVISHTDQDHSGGLYAVIDRVGDTPVVSGTPDSLLQNMPELKSVQNCHQKSSWRWDGVEFEFLNTHQAANESENNRSCVLRISLKDEVILLAGDIEASQEKLLLDEYPDKLPATVLLAPHHGSTTSSSEAFIRAVAPQHVIFSSGYLNRWKFPRQQIVQRYQRIAANLYRTDEDGAIQIECTREDCEVEKFRQRYPRIWY
jgi:competence protein ComEC